MFLLSLILVLIAAVFLTGYGLAAFCRHRLYRGVISFAFGSNLVLAAVAVFYDAVAVV